MIRPHQLVGLHIDHYVSKIDASSTQLMAPRRPSLKGSLPPVWGSPFAH